MWNAKFTMAVASLSGKRLDAGIALNVVSRGSEVQFANGRSTTQSTDATETASALPQRSSMDTREAGDDAGSHSTNVGVAFRSSGQGLTQNDLEAAGYDSEVGASWTIRAPARPLS